MATLNQSHKSSLKERIQKLEQTKRERSLTPEEEIALDELREDVECYEDPRG